MIFLRSFICPVTFQTAQIILEIQENNKMYKNKLWISKLTKKK